MQGFYNMNMEFYKKIEQEFEALQFGKYEWLSLHLRYLVYYITKYDIQNREYFTAHHYRLSYRFYLLNFINSATV